MQPIRSLLPFAYAAPDSDARRVVRFNQRYAEAVGSGTKTATVRWDDPVVPGPATFVFEDHPDHRAEVDVVTFRVSAQGVISLHT